MGGGQVQPAVPDVTPADTNVVFAGNRFGEGHTARGCRAVVRHDDRVRDVPPRQYRIG